MPALFAFDDPDAGFDLGWWQLPLDESIPAPVDYYAAPTPIDYRQFITSQYQKPKFRALVDMFTRSLDEVRMLLQSMPALFDVDYAVGDQLDKVAAWVGINRNISITTNNLFSFDAPGLGFDQGIWGEEPNTGYFTFDAPGLGFDQGVFFDGFPPDFGKQPTPWFSFDIEGCGFDQAEFSPDDGKPTTYGANFSFDVPGLGFDQGSWGESPKPYQILEPPTFQATVNEPLDDATFRNLVKAKILLNNFDGTALAMYHILSTAFNTIDVTIIDNGDMTIDINIGGVTELWLVRELIAQKYLDIGLCGITINSILIS